MTLRPVQQILREQAQQLREIAFAYPTRMSDQLTELAMRYEVRADELDQQPQRPAGTEGRSQTAMTDFIDYHRGEAVHLRNLAASATTNAVKARLLEQAEEHERLARVAEQGDKSAARGPRGGPVAVGEIPPAATDLWQCGCGPGWRPVPGHWNRSQVSARHLPYWLSDG